jgi:SAM-dependent methyltransferase
LTDYFGEDVAARYDDMLGEWANVEPAVDFLAAYGSPALELGIGTGRIALPLAARGVEVHGIDLSEAMVAKLREKGGDMPVAIGDFATTRVEGQFALVYVVFNTIMNVTTQDAQLAVFENAARHLRPGGTFVVEVALPDLRGLPWGETHVRVSPTGVDEYDVARQSLISHHDRPDGSVWSIPFRYVWPGETDLMARIAGLTLRERYEDWDRSPYTHESPKTISVWAR